MSEQKDLVLGKCKVIAPVYGGGSVEFEVNGMTPEQISGIMKALYNEPPKPIFR